MEQPKSSPVIATWDFSLDLILLEAPLYEPCLQSQAYETCHWSQLCLDVGQDRYFEVLQADFWRQNEVGISRLHPCSQFVYSTEIAILQRKVRRDRRD
jgi:hypothetical protein